MQENQKQKRPLPVKKHKFLPQISILDYDDPKSDLNQSQFRGFYSMIFMLIIFYLGGLTIGKLYTDGQFMNYNLYNEFRNDFFLVVGLWLVYFLFPIFSYWNIKFLLKFNCKIIYTKIIQHGVQSLMFAGTYALLESQNWCTSHRAFLILLCCSTFMKMHSYAMTNLGYYIKMKTQDKKTEKSKKDDDQKIKKVKFPDNLTMKNFFTYLLMPVLVYEKNFIRTQRPIRIRYIIQKAATGFVYLIGLYTIASDHLLPFWDKIANKEITVFWFIWSQIAPLFFFELGVFYFVFEIFLNIGAELSQFGDRRYYNEFWNSSTYAEFNRDWNKPVHEFLYRHVFIVCIYEMKLSVKAAKFWTFAFSAAVHELIALIIWQKLRGFLLLFMLFQIPLMYWTKDMAGKKSGNLLFWFGLVFGPPLICGLYLYTKEQIPLF